MWIADSWKDYEILDCSGGEKLERWGNYLLVRPDPQVIWDTPKKNRGWKEMNGHSSTQDSSQSRQLTGTGSLRRLRMLDVRSRC